MDVARSLQCPIDIVILVLRIEVKKTTRLGVNSTFDWSSTAWTRFSRLDKDVSKE